MLHHLTYRVGGNLFAVDFHDDLLSETALSPYTPFMAAPCPDEELLFTLSLTADTGEFVPSGQLMADLEDENGRMLLTSLPDCGTGVCLSTPEGSKCCHMAISAGYSHARAWIGGSTADRRHALDTALMLLYTFASAGRDTLLLHASAVECDGRAYLFLGKSGTGKSTHSRLWIEHIPGTRLLNDDNPVLRVIDGKAYVFGSPWSGKTPCYRDSRFPLGGIARLHQAPYNFINPLFGVKAYAALRPSCSCMKWDHRMAEAVHATICSVISSVPVIALGCRPDSEAALLSHRHLSEPPTSPPPET